MTPPNANNWSITLQPHRSLTRQGFIAVMAIVVGVNLVAGVLFLALGAWPILGFLGLDVLIVWWAFRRNFADSDESERIVATGDVLTLQRLSQSGEMRELHFNRRWVKVELEFDAARELVGRLFLLSHGARHEIATFLGAEERQSLAKALRRGI